MTFVDVVIVARKAHILRRVIETLPALISIFWGKISDDFDVLIEHRGDAVNFI